MRIKKVDPQKACKIFKKLIGESHDRFREFDNYLCFNRDDLIGFISIGMNHGYPHLWHLFLRKEARTPDNARKAIRKVMGIVREKGYDRMILHADNERIKKLIEYYFKAKPYHHDAEWWYFVEVKT